MNMRCSHTWIIAAILRATMTSVTAATLEAHLADADKAGNAEKLGHEVTVK